MESKINEDNNSIENKNKKFYRAPRSRHSDWRVNVCDSETQKKKLNDIGVDYKRYSMEFNKSDLARMGIFNFENNEDENKIIKEKSKEFDNDNNTNKKNPDDENNLKKEEEKKEEDKKEEEKKEEEKNDDDKKDEDKKEEDKKEDDKKEEDKKEEQQQQFLGPLNEKDELRIPLKSKNKFKKDDFDVVALSGKGAYGTVVKVKFKNDLSGKFYAIKIMDVLAIDRIQKLYQAYLECDILSELDSPYIVDILGAFDEHRKIYIVMQYLSKGDFSDFLRLNYPLPDETIRFYASEIVNFLHYIQTKKLVHRDLKPENIMMNSKCHLQVIDFATARILGKYFDKNEMKFKEDPSYDISETEDIIGKKVRVNTDSDDEDDMDPLKPERRGMTFVGTAEYVSPEVLGDKPAGFGSDIWALGIMIYQMYYGKTPFKEKTNYLIFRKIEQLKINFEPNVKIPEEAKDLISKILVKEPDKRLGAGEIGTEYDIEHLKGHPYFKGIDWDNLHNLTPPYSENLNFPMSKALNKTSSIQSNNAQSFIKDMKKEANKENQIIILRKGYLEKKSPWLHYNKRKIILDSTPKLIYIDPEKNKIKGEIYLDRKFRVVHIDMNTFEIVSPKRNYKFKGSDGDALVWEKTISDAIKTYGK